MQHATSGDITLHKLAFALQLGPYDLVIKLFIAMFLTGLALWTGLRSMGRGQGRMLLTLRLAIVVSTLATALMPEWVETDYRRQRPHVAVVVDNTKSMQVPLFGQPARSVVAAQLSDKVQKQTIESEHFLAAKMHIVPLQSDNGSDLLAGLERIQQDNQGANGRLNGILLISDGADNGAIAEHLASKLSQTVERLRALGTPVSTLMVPHVQDPFVDVAIDHVAHDPLGFIKNTFKVDVSLHSVGLPKDRDHWPVTIKLTQDGVEVARKNIQFGQTQEAVQLSFVPRTVGSFAYEVQVVPMPHEATEQNNSYRFVARIVRDKIRVLHVAGHPSWDQRFLRQTLQNRPQIDLVSFYILRTPYSDNSVPEQQLSLIPFPVDRLFTTELQNFDVVVFQNFDFRPFQMEGYMPNLARAIQGGLGFFMLGGSDSFGLGGYGNSALEAMLPTQVGTASLDGRPASFVATEMGLRHPLLHICPGAPDDGSCLTRLPKLERINALGAVHEDATVLATAEWRTQSGAKTHVPLLVARPVGLGRTLSLATDTLWYWPMADGALSEAARAYDKFWQQALLWLTHDAETLPLQVVPKTAVTSSQTPIDVALTLLQPDPSKQLGEVELAIVPLPEPSTPRPPEVVCKVFWGADGTAGCRVPGQAAGAYRLTARTLDASGVGAQKGQAVVVVQDHTKEMVDLRSNPKPLQLIAEATGGKVMSADHLLQDLATMPQQTFEGDIKTRERRKALWDNPYVLAALASMWLLEIVLRRRLALI